MLVLVQWKLKTLACSSCKAAVIFEMLNLKEFSFSKSNCKPVNEDWNLCKEAVAATGTPLLYFSAQREPYKVSHKMLSSIKVCKLLILHTNKSGLLPNRGLDFNNTTGHCVHEAEATPLWKLAYKWKITYCTLHHTVLRTKTEHLQQWPPESSALSHWHSDYFFYFFLNQLKLHLFKLAFCFCV